MLLKSSLKSLFLDALWISRRPKFGFGTVGWETLV